MRGACDRLGMRLLYLFMEKSWILKVVSSNHVPAHHKYVRWPCLQLVLISDAGAEYCTEAKSCHIVEGHHGTLSSKHTAIIDRLFQQQ